MDPERIESASREQPGLIRWFVGNHVAANLLMFFLVAGGLLAMFSMRTELFPAVDPRTISVRVPFPGATTQEVEDGITRRIEEAVIGIEGVKQVTAVAEENLGRVTLEIEEFANTREVLDDVETAVDQLAEFPPQDAEQPIIAEIQPQPTVLTLALHGDVPELTLKRWAQRLEDELLRLPLISLVSLRGAKDDEISITVSEQVLRRYDLDIERLGRIIAASSQDISAGTIASDAGDILLRVQEKGEHAPPFEQIVVRQRPDGSLLRLGDLAVVRDGLADQDLIARYDGRPAIFIEISRSESQDALATEQAVQDYLQQCTLPAGLRLDILENQTDILKQRINLLARNGLLGFTLVFLVLLLFLDLKLAVWTSLGIPISFLGGLLIVHLMGLSFNMITLFALIIVLGIVVDDAIVTGESIFAEQERGREDEQAAVHGVGAIRAPVTVGVLTTAAAFAPLAFTSGTLGQILRPIPVFVISILFISLTEAFTILPVHLSSSHAWGRGVVAAVGQGFNRLLFGMIDRLLLPALRVAYRWRYAVAALFAGLLIVMAGMVRGGRVRFIFFPQIEGDEVTATLVMPVGTPFDVTRAREELKVMVRYPPDDRERLRSLEMFRVTLPNGDKAPLDTVARIRQQRSYAEVKRVNGRRIVNVTADVDARESTHGETLTVIMEDLAPMMRRLYPDLHVRIAGESEDRREDLQSLGRNMLIAILIIFVLLGAQLRSYVQPLLIMSVIPFGMIGSVFGHLWLGFDLSFVSIFGMVALTGVVINDSVVLIDYFNRQRRDKQQTTLDGICEAVRRRFRPILLTTMTTSFGLLPMLLETSLQARFLIPMAISLAFGLLFASGILVFLLPVLIGIVEDARDKLSLA